MKPWPPGDCSLPVLPPARACPLDTWDHIASVVSRSNGFRLPPNTPPLGRRRDAPTFLYPVDAGQRGTLGLLVSGRSGSRTHVLGSCPPSRYQITPFGGTEPSLRPILASIPSDAEARAGTAGSARIPGRWSGSRGTRTLRRLGAHQAFPGSATSGDPCRKRRTTRSTQRSQ